MKAKGIINKSHYVECLVPDCTYAQSSLVDTYDQFIDALNSIGWIQVGSYWICPSHSASVYAHKKAWIDQGNEREDE